ncbi:hypothetical protein TNCV_4719741 [Trichonephila clavipes]|uniref:Uncharacterized protein n=1 Tax=Trichonephila clavipes TaxID=2585209 RepID=A0A8X6W6Z1_TRICX|nr:hypothetical protein TNCV_4719741 [Trichonephila clavipes]
MLYLCVLPPHLIYDIFFEARPFAFASSLATFVRPPRFPKVVFSVLISFKGLREFKKVNIPETHCGGKNSRGERCVGREDGPGVGLESMISSNFRAFHITLNLNAHMRKNETTLSRQRIPT